MLFEEVLPLLREGKKARHGRMKEGEYWICGYATMPGLDKWLTLFRGFDNCNERSVDTNSSSWSSGFERWAICCDSWEIIEGKADNV